MSGVAEHRGAKEGIHCIVCDCGWCVKLEEIRSYVVGIHSRPVVDGAIGLFVILRDDGNCVGDLFGSWHGIDDPELVVAWWVIIWCFIFVDVDRVVVAYVLFVHQIVHPLTCCSLRAVFVVSQYFAVASSEFTMTRRLDSGWLGDGWRCSRCICWFVDFEDGR